MTHDKRVCWQLDKPDRRDGEGNFSDFSIEFLTMIILFSPMIILIVIVPGQFQRNHWNHWAISLKVIKYLRPQFPQHTQMSMKSLAECQIWLDYLHCYNVICQKMSEVLSDLEVGVLTPEITPGFQLKGSNFLKMKIRYLKADGCFIQVNFNTSLTGNC